MCSLLEGPAKPARPTPRGRLAGCQRELACLGATGAARAGALAVAAASILLARLQLPVRPLINVWEIVQQAGAWRKVGSLLCQQCHLGSQRAGQMHQPPPQAEPHRGEAPAGCTGQAVNSMCASLEAWNLNLDTWEARGPCLCLESWECCPAVSVRTASLWFARASNGACQSYSGGPRVKKRMEWCKAAATGRRAAGRARARVPRASEGGQATGPPGPAAPPMKGEGCNARSKRA